MREWDAEGVRAEFLVDEKARARPVFGPLQSVLVPCPGSSGVGEEDVVGGYGFEKALGFRYGCCGESGLSKRYYSWVLEDGATDCVRAVVPSGTADVPG